MVRLIDVGISRTVVQQVVPTCILANVTIKDNVVTTMEVNTRKVETTITIFLEETFVFVAMDVVI